MESFYKGWTITMLRPDYFLAYPNTENKKGVRADTEEKVKELIDKHDDPYLVSCPFCGEKEFDKIGLKHHLINGYCEEYLNTQSIERKF